MPKENFSMVISVEIGRQQQMFGFVTICKKFPLRLFSLFAGGEICRKIYSTVNAFSMVMLVVRCIQLTCTKWMHFAATLIDLKSNVSSPHRSMIPSISSRGELTVDDQGNLRDGAGS